jgi:uncharacterized protein YlxW (UPF0749 family)
MTNPPPDHTEPQPPAEAGDAVDRGELGDAAERGEPADAAEPGDAAEPAETAAGSAEQPSRRFRTLSGALIAVLCLALGLGIATQVRHTRSGDTLAEQRPQDLVVLLDGLQQREAALRREITQADQALHRLQANGDTSAAALDEARRRAGTLAVLAGTVPVRGPGLELDISDPAGRLTPDTMLDVLQELRGAGAEAIQVGPVRIGVNSSFTGAQGAVLVDGKPLDEQVRVLAVGDPPTLAAALNIPGGVVDTVRRGGGQVFLRQAPTLQITALRSVPEPQYARPAK